MKNQDKLYALMPVSRSFLLLVLFTALALSTIAGVAEASHRVSFLSSFDFEKPLRVATDGSRLFLITKNGTVHIVARDGKILKTLANKDLSGNTILKKPSGIAVYNDGIYITDRSLDKVVVFSASGEYRSSFGSGGSGPREFSSPKGIFVYHGNIYVADTGNDRIQVFGPNGVFLRFVGDDLQKENRLRSPLDLVVDPKGHIHAIDGNSNIVKTYSQNGRLLNSLKGFQKPSAITVSDDGFFVADTDNCNITKFSFSMGKIYSFGTMGDGKAQFKGISGVSADVKGNVYVADLERGSLQTIFLDKDAIYQAPVAMPPPTSVRWEKEIPIEVKKISYSSKNGRIYGIDSKENAVVIFKGSTPVMTIKLPDRSPVSVAVDHQGNPWVIDREESEILKLDQGGTILFKFGGSGNREGYFSKPGDIVIGSEGNIYIADSGNDRVQVFNKDGLFLNSMSKQGEESSFTNPVSIALDSKQNLYALTGTGNIFVFTPSGKLIAEFGKGGKERVRLDEPVSIAVGNNEVFVLDSETSSVKIFSLSGDFIREFGSKGQSSGDFRDASSIAVAEDNQVIVADTGNKRVQFFRSLYTPPPPKEISTKAGMRYADISWKAGDGNPAVKFRLYRKKDGEAVFTEIAGTAATSFRDVTLLPGVSYRYMVSSFIDDGYENIPEESVVAIPLKFKPPPPSNIITVSQEWSVDISWDPSPSDYFDHYSVYYEGDEEDGTPVLLEETLDTFISAGGLEPDTAYRYWVSAVSIDGVESDRIPVDIATLMATKPPLQIDIVKINDIFSNTYKIYETEGIGHVKLTNNTRDRIENLKVGFYIKDFMDFPTETEVAEIAAGEGIEIPVKAVFSNRVLEMTEDTPVQTELKVSYFRNEEPVSFSRSQTVNLYDKHRMVWNEKDRIATFISPKDPVLLEFTRAVVTQYANMSSPLVYAAAIFEQLGALGMAYLPHPNNPYQVTDGKTDYVDYIQYPRETLKRNSGVCTDLVVLFSSALESIGIKTTVLGVPGHLFMMFSIGKTADLGTDTINEMLAIYDEQVWVPVETTLIGTPFMKAWEKGSSSYNEWKEKSIEYTDPVKAWNRYKPASLPVTDWRINTAKRADVDKKFNGEISRINKMRLKLSSYSYIAALKSNPSDLNAMIQLGIIFGEADELFEAQGYFEKASAIAPENPEIINNLGNILYLQSKYNEAAAAYEKAARLDKSDPYILVNLSLCYIRLGMNDKAAATFRTAAAKDPQILNRYRAVAMELQITM